MPYPVVFGFGVKIFLATTKGVYGVSLSTKTAKQNRLTILDLPQIAQLCRLLCRHVLYLAIHARCSLSRKIHSCFRVLASCRNTIVNIAPKRKHSGRSVSIEIAQSQRTCDSSNAALCALKFDARPPLHFSVPTEFFFSPFV